MTTRAEKRRGIVASLGTHGQQMIATRNGSDLPLTQSVWGLTYIDELVQKGQTRT